MDGTAATAATTITGGGGVDNLTGGTKDDTINGGAGNDAISLGSGGNDTVNAVGDDTIDVDSAGTSDLTYQDDIDGGVSTDTSTVAGSESDIDFMNVSNVEKIVVGTTGTNTSRRHTLKLLVLTP